MVSALVLGTGCPNRSLCLGAASPSLDLSMVLSFFLPPAVPWRRRRHSGASTAPLPAIEGVLESPRLPLSNGQSGAGPAVHLGRSFAHTLSSIGWRRQPRCCSESEQNKLIFLLIRTRRRAGLSLDAYARGFGPVRRHHDDLQRRQKSFLWAILMAWHGASMAA